MEDAERSLSNMMDDFLATEEPQLSKAERRERAQTLSPSIISPFYEEELKKVNSSHPSSTFLFF